MFGKPGSRVGPLRPALVMGLALLLAGCSSKGTVSGKVIYKGKPLTGGTVTFMPEGGVGAVTSEIGPDGSYTISKIAPGPVKIAVYLPPPEVKQNTKLPEGVPEMGAKMFQAQKTAKPGQVDPKLSDPNKSGLTYTVKTGSQNYDIEIK